MPYTIFATPACVVRHLLYACIADTDDYSLAYCRRATGYTTGLGANASWSEHSLQACVQLWLLLLLACLTPVAVNCFIPDITTYMSPQSRLSESIHIDLPPFAHKSDGPCHSNSWPNIRKQLVKLTVGHLLWACVCQSGCIDFTLSRSWLSCSFFPLRSLCFCLATIASVDWAMLLSRVSDLSLMSQPKAKHW